MKLLIQLVREILHLSGKSQGISNTYGCGNHEVKKLFKLPSDSTRIRISELLIFHLTAIQVAKSCRKIQQKREFCSLRNLICVCNKIYTLDRVALNNQNYVNKGQNHNKNTVF